MNSLKTDFTDNNGTYMVLTAESLHSSNMNRNQCSMLASNRIPHLLDLRIQEVDFEVKLHYEITGKRMLSHVLKSESMSQSEFYGLLLQITSALADSSKYMLQPSQYLLEEAYIFIDGSLASGTVYLTYLPVKNSQTSGQVIEQQSDPVAKFLNLMMSLLPSVTGFEGAGVQQITKLCREREAFTFGHLKSLLLQLLEGTEGERPEHLTANRVLKMEHASAESTSAERISTERASMKRASASFSEGSAPPAFRHLIEPDQKGKGFPLTDRLNGYPALAQMDKFSPEGELDPQAEEVVKTPSSRRTVIVSAAVLLVALSWKFVYLDAPDQSRLILASVLTAAVIGLAVVLLRRKPLSGTAKAYANNADEADEANEANEADNAIKTLGVPPIKIKHVDSTQMASDSQFPYLKEEKQAGQSQSLEDLLGTDKRQTRQIHQTSQSRQAPQIHETPQIHQTPQVHQAPPTHQAPQTQQATVLLSRDQISEHAQIGRLGVLERREKGNQTLQRIELTPGSFVIGRTPEVAQCIESSPGTSRAHIEIMVNEQNWRIKDLGSKNGSILNGENMVPYKDYPLFPGDEFRIAGVSYTLSPM
ncbi:DUF6382 domain-containing protein [Paenibacillus pinistramenti]|uniref:DUF6382 domain-containing protein n=1 Tax=Paenibacillus pinistramenti TaxID=1768003 RepID=UPI0011084F49|nr:DUF6382 domain-containing protein [Paenibacillus pinistramenti]